MQPAVERAPKIVVVGRINVGLTAHVERLPAPGETVAVGDDDGRWVRDRSAAAGVDVEGAYRGRGSST